MKFCEKCGAQVEDNNAFCLACGAKMDDAANTADNAGDAAAPLDTQKLIKIGVIAVAAILVIVIISSLFGGGYKGAAKKWVKANLQGKTGVVKSLAPKDIWEYYDDELKVDVDDVKDAVEDSHDDSLDEWEDEYGKNPKVSYKVESSKKLDKRDVKKINKALEERYDIDDNLVKAAYRVEIDVKIKGKDDYYSNDTFITVVKIKGKWYPISYYDGDEVSARFLLDSYASSAAND